MKLPSMRERSEPVVRARIPPPSSDRHRRNSLLVLPHEVVVEILCWLPVRTLIQLRCVSKSLKTLISDPNFIKAHLTKIKSLLENDPSVHQRLLHIDTLPSTLLQWSSLSLYSVFNSQTDDVHVSHLSLDDRSPWNDQGNLYLLAGSCDGLVCFYVRKEFLVLWNPTTRVFNQLPDLGVELKQSSYSTFGFGYDSEMDDYKVVAVLCTKIGGGGGNGGLSVGNDDDGDAYDTSVKVLSRQTNSWRSIGSFRYGVPYEIPAKYVKGNLFWTMRSEKLSIVCFDLAKETYKEIIPPDYGELCSSVSLKVSKDFLCVYVFCFRNDCGKSVHVEAWAMEYRVSEPWTKVVSITNDQLGNDRGRFSIRLQWPFYIAANGEILLNFMGEEDHGYSSLLIYNPKDRTFRKFRMSSFHLCISEEVYFESLVSPFIEN